MKCDKCAEEIRHNEERELHGQRLCEDCCIDILSPARACDPWAVYSAKSFASGNSAGEELTGLQTRILQLLKQTGGAEPSVIAERLQIRPSDLEREVATLRHMEKVRGELRDGKRFIRLW